MGTKLEQLQDIFSKGLKLVDELIEEQKSISKPIIEFKKKVVLIDDGHAKNTLGKRTPKFADGSFMIENDFNRPTAYYLKELCDNFGYLGVIVHPFDKENIDPDVALSQRMKMVDDLYYKYEKEGNEVILISIHADAATSDGSWHPATGTTSFYWRNKEKTSWSKEGFKLASFVHKEMLKLGMKDRALSFENSTAVGKNLGILRTKPVSCLVECEFMTNQLSALKLRSDEFRRACSNAMFVGIKTYWND